MRVPGSATRAFRPGRWDRRKAACGARAPAAPAPPHRRSPAPSARAAAPARAPPASELAPRAGRGPTRHAGSRAADRTVPAAPSAPARGSPRAPSRHRHRRTKCCSAISCSALSTGRALSRPGLSSRSESSARSPRPGRARRLAAGSDRAALPAADTRLRARSGSASRAHGTASARRSRARDRHVMLLHRLQQRRLRARRGAVDFVRHQQAA